MTAVFTGSGTFTLKPLIEPERNYLVMATGADSVEQEFESAVFLFADGTEAEVRTKSSPAADDGHAASTLRRFRSRCQRRAMTAGSFVGDLLQDDQIQNLEAEVLAELYNPPVQDPSALISTGASTTSFASWLFREPPSATFPRRRSRSSTWTLTVHRTGSGTSLT